MYVTEDFLGLPLTQGATVAGVLDVCESHLAAPVRSRALKMTFINPHAWHVAMKHPDYRSLLRGCDLVLPDGIGVVIGARRIAGRDCVRISFDFSSLAGPFFELCARRGWRVAFVGAGPGTAEAAAERIRGRYSDLHICHIADGYGQLDAMTCAVNERSPEVAIVGMGAPCQERFVDRLAASGFDGIAVTCGGFFDQCVRSLEYYPAVIDKLELRFAYRLVREPRRLGRRYLVEYIPFVARCCVAIVGNR